MFGDASLIIFIILNKNETALSASVVILEKFFHIVGGTSLVRVSYDSYSETEWASV